MTILATDLPANSGRDAIRSVATLCPPVGRCNIVIPIEPGLELHLPRVASQSFGHPSPDSHVGHRPSAASAYASILGGFGIA